METLYLLGAGASAKAIPVVGNFKQSLYEFITTIKEDKAKKLTPFSTLPDTILNELIILHEGIEYAGTPDIFAKSLLLQDKKYEYFGVKRALSFFLTLLQINEELHKAIDPRYLGFFAALLEKEEKAKARLHKDIRIATWNYDLQIPIALSILSGMDFSRVHYYLGDIYHSDVSKSTNPGKFFRLNGYAGSYFNNKEISAGFLEEIFSDDLDSHDKVVKLIKIFEEIRGIAKPFINFAWDQDPVITTERNLFFQSLNNTRVIVVIGYSFPTFNRFIDKELFQSCGYLEKVYVQDTNPEIIQRVEGVI